MCYGCQLQTKLGETETINKYLDIRQDYERINEQINNLLAKMLVFEQAITDRVQRKAFHATRKRIMLAKKMGGEAMSHIRPEEKPDAHH